MVRAYPVPAKNAKGIIISHPLIVMLSTREKEKQNICIVRMSIDQTRTMSRCEKLIITYQMESASTAIAAFFRFPVRRTSIL
jgi:hypothetical protein